MTKTYKIKAGAWFTYYKEVEFTVEADEKPTPEYEQEVINLWYDRTDTLKITPDPTSEEVEWVDMDKLEIEEL